jgi:hypothetical protein
MNCSKQGWVRGSASFKAMNIFTLQQLNQTADQRSSFFKSCDATGMLKLLQVVVTAPDALILARLPGARE